jgi:hypothetical protein
MTTFAPKQKNSMQTLLQRAKLLSPSSAARNISLSPNSREEVHIPVLLDPPFAEMLLENNTDNRNVDRNVVDAYAQDIRDGRWVSNGSTICIANTGRVLDGQQRLLAVIQSGLPIPVTMVFNLEDSFDVFSSIDIGKVRTTANIMQIFGNPTKQTVQATSNMLAFLDGHPLKTKQRQAEYLIEQIDEIEPWVEWSTGISSLSSYVDVARRRIRGVGTVTLATLAIHMNRRGADSDEIQEFFTGILMELPTDTMRRLSDNRINILKLLNRRIKNGNPLNRGTGGQNNVRVLPEFALYIKCYNRYLNNEAMKKAQIGDTEYRLLDDLPVPLPGGKR